MPSKGDEPGAAVGGSRVRRDSEQTPPRSKRKKTAEDDHLRKHGEKERTRSSGGEKSGRKSETTKPSFWRRATDALDTSKARPVSEKKEAARKDSERRMSSRYVYERPVRRQSVPLSSQRRSASVSVTQGSKNRQPRSSTPQSSSKPANSTSASRPSLHRRKTTSSKEKPALSPFSPRPEERGRAHSFSGSAKLPPSVIGSVMSSSKTKTVKQVECITCMDEMPATEGNYLKHCQHYWCDACLKRVFDLSVTDVQHMPPKCCDNIPIQPKVAMHLYKSEFRKLWNAKFSEWTTKDRLYCPAKGCGAWIKPEFIKLDKKGNKVYGKCPKCSRKVCPKCNCKYHPDKKECPDDPETAAFVKTAKDNGWQNCGQCGQTIERIEGCHHMTCPPPCNYQFCILCGAKWKSCDCPWFTPDMLDAARRQVQGDLFPDPFQMPGQAPQAPPRHARRLNYEEEMEMRREQVRLDEALARRLAQMNMDGGGDDGAFDNGLPDFFHGMPPQFVLQARDALFHGRMPENARDRARLMTRPMHNWPRRPEGEGDDWVPGAPAAPFVRNVW